MPSGFEAAKQADLPPAPIHFVGDPGGGPYFDKGTIQFYNEDQSISGAQYHYNPRRCKHSNALTGQESTAADQKMSHIMTYVPNGQRYRYTRWVSGLLPLLLLASSVELWGAQPHFEETEVFVSGQDTINTYRIPSMISTRNGTVLVFCEGRRYSSDDGSPTDLVLKRSLGRHSPWVPAQNPTRATANKGWETSILWQPMQTLLSSTNGEAYMNPIPLIDKSNGTIVLLVNYYPQPYKDVPVHIWLMKSNDEGATWSHPVDITSGTGLKELGPGIGIQMQNGRLVAPTYDGVIFSDDHGKTWKSGEKISGLFNETQVVELADGSLMLNIREGGHRGVVISKDDGETWGRRWKDKTLIDPKSYLGNQASLIRYTRKKDGYSKDRLLFSNPADPNARFNMTVRISYDEGRTWPVARRIKNGPGAYSCLTVLPDGTIGLIYEAGNMQGKFLDQYSRISFVRFNLEWLTNSEDRLTRPRNELVP